MRSFLLAILLTVLAATAAEASHIKSDENVVFFNTAARKVEGKWVVPVHAWVFEPEEHSLLRKVALAGLVEAFELDESAAGDKLFRERARWFLVDNQGGKQVEITLPGGSLPTTGPNGHTEAEFHPGVEVTAGQLAYAARLPSGDTRSFTGRAFLVEEEGVSVISDIDDTIKISEVRDKKKLMENTFLKAYEPAPGMPEAFQRLARAGASFHYVSSSPWQLYPVLDDFMKEAGFPAGSMHLRIFRMKDDTILNVLKSSEETKPPVINKLLSDYPKRQFVLVGDSGEKDPEIYARIARENPGRIKRIYIRDVSGDKADGERYKAAFDGVDCPYIIFTDAKDIDPEVLKP